MQLLFDDEEVVQQMISDMKKYNEELFKDEY